MSEKHVSYGRHENIMACYQRTKCNCKWHNCCMKRIFKIYACLCENPSFKDSLILFCIPIIFFYEFSSFKKPILDANIRISSQVYDMITKHYIGFWFISGLDSIFKDLSAWRVQYTIHWYQNCYNRISTRWDMSFSIVRCFNSRLLVSNNNNNNKHQSKQNMTSNITANSHKNIENYNNNNNGD